MIKCADCGFLAVRNLRTRQLEEAEKEYRDRAYISLTGEEGKLHPRLESLPLCFVASYDLQDEIRNKSPKKEVDSRNIIAVVNADRDCDKSTKWLLGFTPKEHQDILDRQEILKWQIDREKADKKWRLIELIVLGLISVFIAGGFTILGAFIARGT